jgi:hypothetical protein
MPTETEDTAAPRPAGRYEWERALRRVGMPTPTVCLALALGTYASPNGSDIRPGLDQLANLTNMSTRTVQRHLRVLEHDYGLVRMTRRGGGRSHAGDAAHYQLTVPAELAAPTDSDDTQVAPQSPDLTDSPDTQVAPQSTDSDDTQVAPQSEGADGLRRQNQPIETTQLCRPTTQDHPTSGYESACLPDRNARSKPLAAPLAKEAVSDWHSPAAHRLVEAHAARCRQRPPSTVLTRLAVQVDGLLAESWPEPLIEHAVNAWSAKGLDPKSLHSVANEVANRDPPATLNGHANGHRPSTTDARVLAAQALKTQSRTELEGGQT